MRLIHYSEQPLVNVYSREHGQGAGCYKTPGLWVSVEGDDDWVAWCRSEGWGIESFKHATEIVLASSAKVLHLEGETALDGFTEEFVNGRGPIWHREVDWQAVRARWQGIIIAPYVWSRRLAGHTSWYYGWDCASGVIWDADAVGELRPAEVPQFDHEDA